MAYGGATVSCSLPDNCTVDSFGPRRSGERQTVACDQFHESLKQCGRFDPTQPYLFIVNDAYRPTPTSTILAWLNVLYPELLAKSQFLVATGTHPHPNKAQLRTIFGELLTKIADRVFFHDCHTYEGMVSIGTDSFDQSVYLSKRFLHASRAVVIGSVEPHYFAGFAGGRKGLFPGLTDFATIERNHNLANSLECQPMRLGGNPMAEHLEELLDMSDTSKVISIQVVQDKDSNIAAIYVGDIRESFYDAVITAEKLYGHLVTEPYDLSLCEILPPLDSSLYQVQKGLENNQGSVRDGGAIILAAACKEGIGSESFFKLADEWDVEKNCPNDGKPRFGSHKLSRVNSLRRQKSVMLYSELDEHDVRRVFYEPVKDLQQKINELCEKETSCRVAVVYDAAHTVVRYQS